MASYVRAQDSEDDSAVRELLPSGKGAYFLLQ